MARPSRPCQTPGCPSLRPCVTHPHKPFANARRTGAHLYRTQRWKRERAEYLAANPYCVAPSGDEMSALCWATSTVVDHRIPHRGDEQAFWNQNNWNALCRGCHNAKTGRETRKRVNV